MRRSFPLLVMLAWLAAGCGDGADTPSDGGLVVFAAASLSGAFEEIGAAFEEANPGIGVTFSFAGSSTLATQINQGAPAGVFAAANPENMARVVEAGNAAAEPTVFATNALAIAVESGNPLGIGDLLDLSDPGAIVVLCAPQVPCGSLANEILDRAGVHVTPRSLEPDVKSVLTKVELGEADAGIVYATDVVAAGGGVGAVAIPPGQNTEARYPIAPLSNAPNPVEAEAFIEFVLGRQGQSLLAGHGFGSP